jgi:zona occludens toxin (predicted ATPase)
VLCCSTAARKPSRTARRPLNRTTAAQPHDGRQLTGTRVQRGRYECAAAVERLIRRSAVVTDRKVSIMTARYRRTVMMNLPPSGGASKEKIVYVPR